MIKRSFEYHAPANLAEATALLASANGETAIVAGGTWVVVEMNQGIRSPERVVDLRNAGLDSIRTEVGGTVVGATVSYAQAIASADVPEVLRSVCRGITGGGQLRNRGTLGGSACYANPASDVPAVLLGLGAILRLASAGGMRDVAAAEFFTGAFQSDVGPGELLAEIVLPALDVGARAGYAKFKLCESSWPIATAICVTGRDGAVTSLALGGVEAVPLAVREAVGATDAQSVKDIAAAAVVAPWTDALASGDYRRSIAGVIAKRAFLAAA